MCHYYYNIWMKLKNMKTGSLTQAGISVGQSAAYCKLGNGTVRNLCQDTIYTHPSTKQCDYSYVHPTTKQCSWEPEYRGLKIINEYEISDTTTVNFSGAKFVTFASGRGNYSSLSHGEVRISTNSGSMYYWIKRIDYPDQDPSTGDGTGVNLYTYLQQSSPSGIIVFDHNGMFVTSFSSNCIVYANGYGDPSDFNMEVRYMQAFSITIYG